jgi:predicted phosphodiesterase
MEHQNGVLFLNPGSAGPGRFTRPVTLARLRVQGASLRARLVELKV